MGHKNNNNGHKIIIIVAIKIIIIMTRKHSAAQTSANGFRVLFLNVYRKRILNKEFFDKYERYYGL